MPSASSAEIGRAYRKKSLDLHPDKNPGVKGIQERFARLGVVAAILRGPQRERYDFFHKNGFPTWRGTGYYYSRFRPGIWSVLIFLTLITSVLQHVVHRMNYNRDLARIDRFVTAARRAAWGPKLARVDGRRKVKVNIGNGVAYDEDDEPVPGKVLDMIVEGDSVYILEPSGELLPLDASAATPPKWSRTWPVVLISGIQRRFFPANKVEESEPEEGEVEAEAQRKVPQPVGKIAGTRRRKVPGR